MERTFIISIICSILIHIILILLLTIHPIKYRVTENNATLSATLLTPVPLIDKKEKEKKIIQSLKSDNYYKSPVNKLPITKESLNKRDEEMCKGKGNTYLGVGIVIQPGTDLITKAPPQYPAYKAGLREGDLLVNPFASSVTPDGYMEFTVNHNGTLTVFRIKAENICFKKK